MIVHRLALVLLGGISAAALAQAPAASSYKPPRASAYSTISKLPDWSGVWSPGVGAGARTPPTRPQLTPAAQKLQSDYQAGKAKGENLQTDAANCVPSGVPGIMRQPYPIEFTYSPGRVNILIETYSQVRRIFTDGRKLEADPDLYFNGHSVGHWEGDTLVVETNGLNEHVTLVEGVKATDKTIVRERFTRLAADRLADEITIVDPALFAAPYTTTQNYTLKPDWEMREYVCQENNRDAADPFGRPSMNIDE